MKTVRRPPYPKWNPGYFPCSSLTPPSAFLTPSIGVLRWIRAYWMDGAADVAETTCTPFQAEADAAPVRLIVRRVKPTPGSQLALFAKYSYHGFITDRDGELLELEADHRRHAEIENAIRDLKYGVGLNHLPSGRFAANGAWLAVQTMAHNLACLDGADRSGRADSHHQDPPAAVLLPGRTAHPLGTPVDPASSGSLALG